MVGGRFKQFEQARNHCTRLCKDTLSGNGEDLPQTMRRGEFCLDLLAFARIENPQQFRNRLEKYATVPLAQYSPEASSQVGADNSSNGRRGEGQDLEQFFLQELLLGGNKRCIQV